MDVMTRLQSIFPAAEDIPGEVRLDGPIAQNTYLAGGKLISWSGPVQEVFSPVCVQFPAGPTAQKLGHFPLLNLEAAEQALAAAVSAYDNGRGHWPTAGVADRIGHVEDFVFRMRVQKAEVVKLLMWEIGKSRQDSEKEFDRTVTYIRDTIEAYKDLDRTSSRFVIQENIIGQVLAANPKQVEQFRGGKTAVMGFFVGQVMKATRGQANPQLVQDVLKRELGQQ